MSRHTLYAYVDGADFDESAGKLESRFAQFVGSRRWTAGRAFVVNQRRGVETCSQPGDLPLWDLGMNLDLPDPGAEQSGWFADVEAVAKFLRILHGEFNRDFVIGIADNKTGVTEDLFSVSTNSPDLARLRTVIGIGNVG
jgi:hypothetical protein